jgi:hypothetical protein
LKVYCSEHDLPSSLHKKMQEYLTFQQLHATSVSGHVIRVRPSAVEDSSWLYTLTLY